MNRSFRKRLFYYIYLVTTIVKGYSLNKDIENLQMSQFWTPERITKLQEKKLKHLLQQHNRYFSMLRTDSDLLGMDNYHTVPILSKSTLRSLGPKIYARKSKLTDTKKTSGGSTGAPIIVMKNKEAMSLELAAAWRGYSWAGISPGDNQARFWGVPHTVKGKMAAAAIDFVCNRKRYSAFNFDSTKISQNIASLYSKNHDYYYGYSSILEIVSRSLREEDRKAPSGLKAIVSTAEMLTQATKKNIENAFAVRVFNEYGCGEVGTIAHECEHGSMHINEENVYLEVVDDNGIALESGSVGRIVITDLNNTVTPLIRYDLGDFGSLSDKPCQCGRSLRVLNNIHGRAYDIIKNKAGKEFHGEFFLYLIEDLAKSGIKVKAIQFSMTSENKLKIKISTDELNFRNAESSLKKSIKKRFCPETDVICIKVDDIPREISGKLRVVKNES